MGANEYVKYWNLTMNCSRHIITYMKISSIPYIYKLSTVSILMSTKRWEEEKS